MSLYAKNWSGYIVSQGERFLVSFLNRTFKGGPKVDCLAVADGLGTNPAGTVEVGSGGLGVIIGSTAGGTTTLAGKVTLPVTALSAANFLIKTATGLASAGSVTLAGTKVGDLVLAVTDLTTPATAAAADFETTITVAGHIQQTGADLHLDTLQFIILHQS